MRFHRQIADLLQALGRILVDAAVEQARGDEVLGLLQRAPQRHRAPRSSRRSSSASSSVVRDAPGIGGSVTGWSITSVFGLQAAVQRREVGERLDRRAGLAQRLRGAVELAQRIGEAADHREDAAGLVFQHQRRALNLGPDAQLGLGVALLLALDRC